MQGYVKNCYFEPKEGDTLFEVDGVTGEVHPTLDGYAIIPIEVYKKLKEKDA